MNKPTFSGAWILSVLSIASNAWAAESAFCVGLNKQVDRWQTYLEKQGAPALKAPEGILAYGNAVMNGNEHFLEARHKTDVSTIFVANPSGDFIRVVTSVPDGVPRSRQIAVGTTLTRNGAAWTALTQGSPYCGTVTLFGSNFDSIYRPILQNNTVIGALYVGDPPPNWGHQAGAGRVADDGKRLPLAPNDNAPNQLKTR